MASGALPCDSSSPAVASCAGAHGGADGRNDAFAAPFHPETLKSRSDFAAARRAPSIGKTGFLLVMRRRGDDGPPRVGFTITRKIGGAVVRNRIRRRLRAAAHAAFWRSAERGADYVLVARRGAETQDFAVLLDDMNRALLRLSKTPR